MTGHSLVLTGLALGGVVNPYLHTRRIPSVYAAIRHLQGMM
jgi:hypothetical protein